MLFSYVHIDAKKSLTHKSENCFLIIFLLSMCVLCGWFKMLTINNNNKQFLKRAASYFLKNRATMRGKKVLTNFLILNFCIIFMIAPDVI